MAAPEIITTDYAPVVIGIVAYLGICACLQTIAQKTHTPNSWMAYISILLLILLLDIAEDPRWWIVLFVLPIVNYS